MGIAFLYVYVYMYIYILHEFIQTCIQKPSAIHCMNWSTSTWFSQRLIWLVPVLLLLWLVNGSIHGTNLFRSENVGESRGIPWLPPNYIAVSHCFRSVSHSQRVQHDRVYWPVMYRSMADGRWVLEDSQWWTPFQKENVYPSKLWSTPGRQDMLHLHCWCHWRNTVTCRNLWISEVLQLTQSHVRKFNPSFVGSDHDKPVRWGWLYLRVWSTDKSFTRFPSFSN